jgi:hypothetical protein
LPAPGGVSFVPRIHREQRQVRRRMVLGVFVEDTDRSSFRNTPVRKPALQPALFRMDSPGFLRERRVLAEHHAPTPNNRTMMAATSSGGIPGERRY